ncbi:hypothetical protein MGG_15984 [Pyricularia oryzae 70-15]|uniref:Uncharacterized protein n=3 Tax=Pyricularia oryzae TaxID=318829 RepID=G4MLY9_PYRO7|nr:uncharacterized protein MGG_15984 [Pyricularia oryzae 70-15]EHA56078.1 hypothetical protein MGG_15984 [Pyricularia oryzae 70-15]ELQ38960.1 hypothetical protein OOU_Y34scaffold00517g11 [Pyricularia oryzae Y34]
MSDGRSTEFKFQVMPVAWVDIARNTPRRSIGGPIHNAVNRRGSGMPFGNYFFSSITKWKHVD